jgi:hypothetical protein
VWWRGRQWAVTEYGIERLDGTYVVEAKRLTENIETYSWPGHMRGRTGWTREEFATAWLGALALHGARVSKAAIKIGARVISRTDPCKFRATFS